MLVFTFGTVVIVLMMMAVACKQHSPEREFQHPDSNFNTGGGGGGGEISSSSAGYSSGSGGVDLWIDARQVRVLSGVPGLEIEVIRSGQVMQYILDPRFDEYLPVIPVEVAMVNFTWRCCYHGKNRDERHGMSPNRNRNNYGFKTHSRGKGGKNSGGNGNGNGNGNETSDGDNLRQETYRYYNFQVLRSEDVRVLGHPLISIPTVGRIPRKPKVFSIHLPCAKSVDEDLRIPHHHYKPALVSTTRFHVGLVIRTKRKGGRVMPGTPIRIQLKKECGGVPLHVPLHLTTANISAGIIFEKEESQPLARVETQDEHTNNLSNSGNPGFERRDDSVKSVVLMTDSCDPNCLKNGGWCHDDTHAHDQTPAVNSTTETTPLQYLPCVCPPGYMGKTCDRALCYPQCMNGGLCTKPGVCQCLNGFHGLHCEGGICSEKCLNGGKCVQKDVCACSPGFYGLRCEYSKCMIPCLNSGKCRGINRCRCPQGYSGNHCEQTIIHVDNKQ